VTQDDELQQCRELLGRLSSELTLAEERQRRVLAEQLHDHVGQALALLRRKLLALRDRAMFSGLEKDLDELVDLSTRTVQSIRSLTFDLSPPALYELGLAPALDWLAERHDGQEGVRVDFQDRSKGVVVEPERRVLLFISVRELLLNSLKHGSPKRVQLELWRTAHALHAQVRDDGCGFDPTAADVRQRPTGFGLFSIRQRLQGLGGALELESTPGQGTRAVVWIPHHEEPR
jgi:signal transduction histidine kinase